MLKVFAPLLLCVFLGASELRVQVLGSGGPELSGRASSGYIVWIDNKARLLIDAGGGTFLHFAQSGAKLEDLDAILITHNHIDHTNDLAAFMKAGFFTDRTKTLPIYGPSGNTIFPDIATFAKRLFAQDGVYAYMADILTQESHSFQITPHILRDKKEILTMNGYSVQSLSVHHGIVPALAFRIEIGDKVILFSGDTNDEAGELSSFAKNADLLVADFAIPQNAGGITQELHMTPSQIALIAKKSKTKHLLLSHIMKRSEAHLEESVTIIKKEYAQKISIAEDLMIIKVE